MAGIEDLGNSFGYIYVVKPDKTTIVSAISNDPDGARDVKIQGVKAQSVALNRVATATLVINAPTGSGNVTSITVGGREQIDIGSPIAYTVATTAIALAELVKNAINTFQGISIDCTATQDGVNATIILPQSTGDGYNGTSAILVNSGNLTVEPVIVINGSDATELYDTSIGYTFFLNADYDASGCACDTTPATEDSLTNAIEITSYIVPRSLTSAIDKQEVDITNGSLSFERKSLDTLIILDTESAASTDDLDTISVIGSAEGDKIIIRGADSGRVTTVKDGTGNIELQGAVDFDTAQTETALELQLIGGSWYEIGRSSDSIGTKSDYRSAGFGIFGTETSGTQAVLTSGAVTFDPASNGKVQKITGSATLVGGLSYAATGTPVNGDEIFIHYDALVDINGFSISIYGVSLTAEQAINGGLIIYSRYVSGVWESYLFPNMDSAKANQFVASTEFYKAFSVTIPKVEVSLVTELLIIDVSFDTNRLGDYKVELPYKCTVKEINGWTTDTIIAGDDADLNFKDDVGASMGTESIPASTTIGTGFTTITPSSNNTFLAGEVLTITATKATPGGNVKCSIKIEKTV